MGNGTFATMLYYPTKTNYDFRHKFKIIIGERRCQGYKLEVTIEFQVFRQNPYPKYSTFIYFQSISGNTQWAKIRGAKKRQNQFQLFMPLHYI